MTKLPSLRACAFALLASSAAQIASAIELKTNDEASVKSAASTIAYGLLTWYSGNNTSPPDPATVAVLPRPYYWWLGGAMWDSMLFYYHSTGDSSYNPTVTQALLSQVGPAYDYMVPFRALEEGNDDQAFWGFATMTAAEIGYPNPRLTNASIPDWITLTENLWNTQAPRWNTNVSSCGGGLKWQIFSFNNGYNYKNSVSNGAFFMLSARLARFTANSTYASWATKTWDWTANVGLLSPEYDVYDGTDDLLNCSQISRVQWTYNTGIYLYGAAVMYNISTTYEDQQLWAKRVTGLLAQAERNFFTPYPNATGIMYEQACETIGTCNYDQFSFKAYLSRYMWATSKLAAFTLGNVTNILETSARAAAGSCVGTSFLPTAGRPGTVCGSKWFVGGYDGIQGPGQQLAALETVVGLLGNETAAPVPQAGVQIKNPIPSPVSTSARPTASSSSLSSAWGARSIQTAAPAVMVAGAILGALGSL